MEFSQKDLIQIVEKSSTLSERISNNFIEKNIQENDTIINVKLERWCQVSAQGDWEKFKKRLAWDDLNVSKIRYALGDVNLADKYHLPKWIEFLNESMKAASLFPMEAFEEGTLKENGLFTDQKPFPFQEFFWPFIHVARQKLIHQAGSNYHLLSKTAHTDIERSLLLSLVHICSQTMEQEFSVFRAFKQTTLIRLLEQSVDKNNSKKEYIAFIKGMLKGELLSFFKKYSVLARLVSTTSNIWVEEIGEFIQRLASDWSEIQKKFQQEIELGQLVAVESSLSDRHQGRSVSVISFSSGLKLVYKPKNIGLEKAYFKILAWFNHQHDLPLSFKLLKVITRSNYGWVEYVEYLPCKNQDETKRYYQRAGMLLSIIYALGGRDFHNENIIAHGEHPVLIDMETLVNHRFQEIEDRVLGQEARYIAKQVLDDSVISTGLLPFWVIGSDGQSYDLSGLGGIEQQETPFQIPEWRNINTDGMILACRFAKTRTENNVPFCTVANLMLDDYAEKFVDGFRQMYQFIVKRRETLLTHNNILTNLRNQEVRVLFRPTMFYSLLIDNTLIPKFVQNGIDRGIEFDILCRAFLSSEFKPPLWPILNAEKNSLEQLDVPLFTTPSESIDLSIAPNQTIKNCFMESSYERASYKLNQLSEQDLERQINLIHISLYSRFAKDFHGSLASKNLNLNIDRVPALTKEELIQKAIEIGIDLKNKTIFSTDGSATWIGLQYVPNSQRFQLQPLGDDLYNGSCGIALFFAALEKICSGSGFQNLALAALQPLCIDLQGSESDQIVKRMGIGGGTGCASIIYGLVRVSQFLEDTTLLENAQKIATLITPDNITTDRNFGIISGSAGTILGLLALFKVSKDQEILQKALHCGYHLLKNRVTTDKGYKAWRTYKGKLMTGAAHGAAGIAYALLCLYRATGNNAFLEATLEANAYENSIFCPKAQNWPDFRGEKPSFIFNWCHGVSGIGLARIAEWDILNTDEIQKDIEAAVKATKQSKLSDIDCLCCGNLGKVEFLLTVAQRLSQPQLFESAMETVAQVVFRAKQQGTYGYGHSLGYKPGFFQGAAGIGYELLRLAYPDILPSVLLWE